MELGTMIKQIRNELGLTLRELAEELELTVNYVQYIEANKRIPSMKKLFKFLFFVKDIKEMDINVDEFLDLYASIKEIPFEKVKEDYEAYLSEQLDEQLFFSQFEKVSLKTHMFKSPEFNLKQTEYYKFPVNDLAFHLDDSNNTKFYGTIELDKSDIKLIDSLIAHVLRNKLENEKTHLKEVKKYEEKIFELKGKEFDPDTDIPTYAEDEHRVNEALEFLKNRGV